MGLNGGAVGGCLVQQIVGKQRRTRKSGNTDGKAIILLSKVSWAEYILQCCWNIFQIRVYREIMFSVVILFTFYWWKKALKYLYQAKILSKWPGFLDFRTLHGPANVPGFTLASCLVTAGIGSSSSSSVTLIRNKLCLTEDGWMDGISMCVLWYIPRWSIFPFWFGPC